MKCDKCNKSYQQNSIAISVGDTKICKTCVDAAASNNVCINEVLAYINTYRHSSGKKRMREVCAGFYKEEEIFEAKTLLHSNNPSLFGECIKRQDSPSPGGRTKDEANLDDIYDWFRKLDDNDISLNICAKNLRRVPRFNPEEAEITSMLERLIKVEEAMTAEKGSHLALISRTSKLEEKVFNGTESLENKLTQVNDNLSKTETQVVKLSNDVENIDKETKSQKSSFADALKTTVSQFNNKSNGGNNNIAANVVNSIASTNGNRQVNLSNSGSQNSNNSGVYDWQTAGAKKKRNKALLGTGRPIPVVSGGTSKIFGAPPPSRHYVLERVLPDITAEDLKKYIKDKNSTLEVRSLECMSHEDATYKKYKVEISVEDCKIIYAPDFWPLNTRIRPFFRKRNVDDGGPSRTNEETGN